MTSIPSHNKNNILHILNIIFIQKQFILSSINIRLNWS